MRAFIALIAVAAAGSVMAKLPPLSDDAKGKAAEVTAKTAHGDKVAAYKLCQSMDRVAAKYVAESKKAGKDVTPTSTAPCADPGPFVYAPPAAAPAPAAAATKPIEAAGAHSPPETAAKPPSTTVPDAAANPAPKN